MLARWQRIEPLAGVVFVVLAVIALFTAGGEDFLADPTELADYYLDDSGRIIAGVAAPVALAVFVASTGIVSIATGVLPRWLGWLSLLLALGFLIPVISWIFWLPFGVWVLAVSVLLYFRPGEDALRTEPVTTM